TADPKAPRRVQIRTLLKDRCVTCHSESGRNDKAHWFPLDSYEKLQPYCQAKPAPSSPPAWLIASLLGLLPLALVATPAFCCTRHPRWTRVAFTALPLAALALMLGVWLVGRTGTSAARIVLGAGIVAVTGIVIQAAASLSELW